MAAPTFDGLAPTGKKLVAPGVDLHELAAANGLKHQALVVHEQWRAHPALGAELQGRLAFMEQPEVGGLVRLSHHNTDGAAFVYPTGTVWSISEVVRLHADQGGAPGVKAGLELCYLVAESLVEAAEAGFAQGVFGHGNVNPWTLFLKQDGQPLVLGYGIPQVELLAWRENPKLQLGEDSFRYAPPERVEGGAEDVSSDLLSLSLVALEVMTGRPVYDGVVADVRQQALRGEGVRRLYQWREKLPQNVREVLGRALKADPDTRFPNGMDFVHAVHDLLGSIDVDGPSLVEVMTKVRATERRGRVANRTGALTPAELAELAADLDPADDRPLPPPRRTRQEPTPDAPAEKPRWTKAARGEAPRADAPSPARASPAAGPPASTTSERPRRRMRGDPTTADSIAPPSGPTPAPAPPRVDDSARERLRRRLRDEPPPAAAAPPGRAEPARAEPVRVEAVRSEAVRAEAVRAEAVRAEAVRAEPGRRAAPAGEPRSGGLREGRIDPTDAHDLHGPDDVDLDPLTGKPVVRGAEPEEEEAVLEAVSSKPDTGRVLAGLRGPSTGPVPPLPPEAPPPAAPPPPLPPPPPGDPATGTVPDLTEDSLRSSAAAALLERLRTSGGRRRRIRSDGSPEATPAPAPGRTSTPAPAPGRSVAPLADPEAPRGTPRPAPGRVAAPAPAPPAPAAPPPREPAPSAPPAEVAARTSGPRSAEVEVRSLHGAVRVPAGPARDVLAAAVARLGVPPVDPTGRFAGPWRLVRGGAPVPPDARVEGAVELERGRSGVRPVHLAFGAGTVTLPLETGLPVRWLLAGLAEWGMVPPNGAALAVGDRVLDPAESLADALGSDLPGIPLVSVRTPRVS